jgi:hypothetical protein
MTLEQLADQVINDQRPELLPRSTPARSLTGGSG